MYKKILCIVCLVGLAVSVYVPRAKQEGVGGDAYQEGMPRYANREGMPRYASQEEMPLYTNQERMRIYANQEGMAMKAIQLPRQREEHQNEHSYSELVEYVKAQGYPMEHYTIETSDGYILDLFRIPCGKEQGGMWSNPHISVDMDESQSMSSSMHCPHETEIRPPVMLVHGLMGSARSFVAGGPTEGLAFVMADRGYDVFLANTRGSRYGLKHTTLDHKTDPAFGRYSTHEIGTKDLPAIMDKILALTNKQKMYTVGHMHGSTALFILASEKPEYNMKMRALISLGPIVYMGRASHPLLQMIAEHRYQKGWIVRNIGENMFSLSDDMTDLMKNRLCRLVYTGKPICGNVYFMLNGFDEDNMNMTTANDIADHLAGHVSTRQVLQFVDMMTSGAFVKYREESKIYGNEDDYNIQNVSAPVIMLFTLQDTWSHSRDVDELANKLPNIRAKILISNLRNSADLLYSKDVNQSVYLKLINAMKNIRA